MSPIHFARTSSPAVTGVRTCFCSSSDFFNWVLKVVDNDPCSSNDEYWNKTASEIEDYTDFTDLCEPYDTAQNSGRMDFLFKPTVWKMKKLNTFTSICFE